MEVLKFTKLSEAARAKAKLAVKAYADRTVDQARDQVSRIRALNYLPKEDQPANLEIQEVQASRELTRALRLDRNLSTEDSCTAYLKRDTFDFNVDGDLVNL